ncbi:MAG TPA: O-antigen ligase family protein [Candidatus Udaeobacter sp.]|nr:O-antigen ligase family protein [Candidatus Udaeobacter sp.]
MKQTILKATKFLIYATFFVPLVVLPASFIFPFIVPKILLFRSLVTLMIGCYILLLCINWQEFKPKFSALNIALFVFLISFAISTFVGVDPYHSFWDNHERMLGLFTIFHYIAYYFICSAVLKDWTDWNKALKIFLSAGSLVMIVGVLQIFKPDMLLNGGSDRVASTLGNSIYVGGYGLFLTFVSFLLFIKEKNKNWKYIEAAAGALAILGMFFSGTRGSMLGLIVGMAVAVVGYIFVLRDFPKTRKVLLGLAIFGVAVIALLYAFRQTSFVQKIPAVNRTINTSFASIQNSARWLAWKAAVESWKEKPLFGWGPNNFFYAFNKYYQPKSLEFGYGETWFDNAHNIIVNTLAVQGAVGLISYLSIFGAAVAVLVVARKKRSLDLHIVVIGVSFLAAHLVQSVTVFENPTSYLYFMFWLAMIISLSMLPAEPAKNPVIYPNKTIGTGSMVSTGIVILFLVFIFDIQPARANMKTLDALKYLSYQPLTGIDLMKTALAFNSPHIDDIRSDLARTVAQVLSSSDNKLGKDKNLEMFNIAQEALQANIVLHPYDIRNYLTLSQLSQVGYSLTNDLKYVAQYGDNLEIALKYSPKRQQVIYNLANFYLQIGRTDDSVKYLKQTIEDDPNVSESYWRLAYVYRLVGQMDKAKEVIDLAAKNGVTFNPTEASTVAQILAPVPTTTPVKTKKK